MMPPAMTELRVHLLKDCVINPAPGGGAERTILPAALLGVVVPKVIESALSGVATALKKAGTAETVQVAGTAFENLYVADAQQVLRANPILGCVLAVWYRPQDDRVADDRIAATLKTAKLIPADVTVTGAFEAVIRTTPDGTAWFLDARHFSVREFVGDRHKDRRSFVVSVAVTAPSADPDGHTVALGHLDFGTVERGAHLIPDGHPEDAFPRYRSNLMPWAPISAASKAAYDRDVTAGRAANRSYMPVTFNVTVSETAEGNAFLLKLGELIGGASKEVAGELGKEVVEKATDAIGEGNADAEKLYDEELKAKVDEAKARKALNDASDEERAAARLAWELAARRLVWRTRLREAAGLPPRNPLDPARA
jgi:hypothetical protein